MRSTGATSMPSWASWHHHGPRNRAARARRGGAAGPGRAPWPGSRRQRSLWGRGGALGRVPSRAGGILRFFDTDRGPCPKPHIRNALVGPAREPAREAARGARDRPWGTRPSKRSPRGRSRFSTQKSRRPPSLRAAPGWRRSGAGAGGGPPRRGRRRSRSRTPRRRGGACARRRLAPRRTRGPEGYEYAGRGHAGS